MTSNWPSGAALLFDLDGTLVDTAPDLSGTLNALLEAEGLAPIPLSDVRHLVGHGARALLENGLATHGEARSPEVLDELVADFVAHYAERISAESVPFPSIVGLLEQFRANSVQLGVVTNKREGLAKQLLDELDLSKHFGAVFGGDTLARRKPFPDPILGAIEALGAKREAAVMIGDTDTDINAAKAAGIPVIAVTFGYSATPIESLGADCLIDHFDELPEAVSRLFA